MNNRKIQLSNIIKDLEKSPEKKTMNFGDFTVIKIPKPADEKSDDKNKYYAIYTGGARWWRPWKRKSGLVGEAVLSSVYLTFPISELPEVVGFDFARNRAKINLKTKTPEIDPKTKKPYQLYVTKIVDFHKLMGRYEDKQEVLLKEVEIFRKYYHAEPYVIQIGDHAHIITEFLTGMLIKTLNYSQRLAIIQELLFNINLMHHETSRTGTAFVHKDIKPDNINVHFLYNDPQDPSSGIKKISVHLMDFGLVRIIDEDNPNRMFQNNRHGGTAGYFAPEV